MKKISWIILIVTVVGLFAAFVPFAKSEEGETGKISDPLAYLYELGIVEGFEDGQLHPERLLTRAQFAKMLNKTYPDVVVHQLAYMFSDLPEEHWAYADVQKALNAGWLKGFDDGTFRPDMNITFEQAVTVICRVKGISADEKNYPNSYISAAIENSLSDGVDALIGENINRMQAARLIVNALAYDERQLEKEKNQSYLNAVMPSASGGGGGGGSFVATESVMMDEAGYYEPEIPYNTEEYVSNDENVFKNTITSPLSTFSIDADTASYSNMRRFILNDREIPNGAIRTEELLNYFDYTPAEIAEGEPFGVRYTVAECPWNPQNYLALITVSGEEISERKPSNLVFLIDTSGSMDSQNKLPLVKESLGLLLDELGEQDMISVVTYAAGTKVALEPTLATEKETIMNVIDNLDASGSTAGADGITLAYQQAEKFKCDGNNRIILCTDGDFNVGMSSTGELEALITEKRESGIFLSVLGFGMGNYKDNRMETLADKGNGNYAYIDNLKEAKKVLVTDMTKTIYIIAKDVKIQVEFNPAKVSEYRLIGYENRQLNNEDFVNDKKDAGELGAGATVTVLYEIVPGNGEVESGLKYQHAEATGSDEMMTVKIRYKLPEGEESILKEFVVSSEISAETDDDFRFAAAVAELGMILNDSEFKGTATLDSVIELAENALGDDPYEFRREFIQLVDLLRYQER